MKKNILSLSVLFLLAKGILAQNYFAPNHLDGSKILFHYGQNEFSILEFTEFAAYEMDDEAGLNREFEGDYDADTEGNTVTVTIIGQSGANDVYTLNFTTAGTGTGKLDDFEYLQPDQVDNTFEPTNQNNIYKDLMGSGEFTFEFFGSQHHDGNHTAYYPEGNYTDHNDGNHTAYYPEGNHTHHHDGNHTAYYPEGNHTHHHDGNHTAYYPEGNHTDHHDETIPYYPEGNHTDHHDGNYTTYYPEGNHTHQEGNYSDYGHHEMEFEPIPVADIEGFVANIIAEFPDLHGARIVRAEKMFDALIENRFAFEVALDRGISLYLDQNKTFVHAGLSGDFAINDYEIVQDSAIIESLTQIIADEVSDLKIIDVEKEFSAVVDQDFVYNVIFESNGTEFDAHLTSDSLRIVLITKDIGGDFADEWRPVDLPDSAKDFLLQTYPELVDATGNYHSEQRPTPNGDGKEFVAFLQDGTEVIFDENGTFFREFNQFKNFQQNLDAGLKFDATRSSNLGNASVNICRVENDAPGSMFYRISITNTPVENGICPDVSNLDISDHFDVDHNLTLSFTYEVGPPRYMVVNGNEVSAFKHRRAEWDKPGSFTIKAKTVRPTPSSTTSGHDLGTSFGISIEMGGERFYEGTIFETEVINLDILPSNFSSPWDPSAGFKFNSIPDYETKIRALIPRRLLSGHYGIMDPDDVLAAVIEQNGTMTFINGSFNSDENLPSTGMGFNRVPHKGFEPQNVGFAPGFENTIDGGAYLLEEGEFGLIDESSTPFDFNQPVEHDIDENISKSKFDFDGDGYANSYLSVRFYLSPSQISFPLEVQIGNPFVDPFANLDYSQFGTITGTVTDSDGNSLKEFDVWFFKVPTPGMDLYSGEPAFFEFERGENGFYTAKLPAGTYHAEAFAYDPSTDTPYKPQLALDSANPRVFTIEGNATNISGVNFSLEEEYRMSHEFARVEAEVSVSGNDEVPHVFFELFPVVDGVRQTDYPVFSLGLERGGKIRGEAPVGDFEVEIFSPDNSLYLPTNLEISIVAGQENILNPIQLLEREMVTVRGSIKDSSDNPIWAEVVFVDPEDDNIRFWPMWDNDVPALSEGEFAYEIPQGDYKILAERFDGMYKSAFYDADSNGSADVVSITSNINGINFVLESRPTATVTVKLLDSNGSDPIKYAWFDFFDAEDEFAPIVFPHLGMIDFESDSFDGTYTLSVPGGNYKLKIGAPEYQSVFQVLDESGNQSWASAEWADGATIQLADGNLTALVTAQMDRLQFSEAELYGFNWLDEGEDIYLEVLQFQEL